LIQESHVGEVCIEFVLLERGGKALCSQKQIDLHANDHCMGALRDATQDPCVIEPVIGQIWIAATLEQIFFKLKVLHVAHEKIA